MTTIVDSWRDPRTRRRADQLFSTLLGLLEMRLPYLRGRAARIDDGCRVMADAMQLKPDERYALSLAARFHDIGLLGIADTVLLKPGPLTADEKTLIDCHTDIGGRLVHHLFADFYDAIEAIWWHHERPDGRGPHGLTGDTIPLAASIVALVDAAESMANDRPQRPGMPEDQIRAEIERCVGTQFDPRVVSAYRSVHSQLYSAVAPTHAVTEIAAPKPAPSRPTGDSPRSAPKPSAPHASASRPGSNPPSSPLMKRGGTVDVSCVAQGGGAAGAFPLATSRTNLPQAISALTPLIKKQDLVRLVNEGLEMKPLAPVVQAVISATSNAQCSGEEVAKAVGQDQTLALRVLKVANSSAYSRGRHIDTLQGAVARLGVQQVRKLVMGLGVLSDLGNNKSSRLDVKLFWEHSIACGLIAATLARCCKSRNADDHFLWGMIHDVGRLILHTQIADTYEKVWETAERLDVPLELVEAKLLLVDHCGVLARALEHWQFPREFLAPVVNHHQSVHKLGRLAPRVAMEATIVALADRIAHALLMGSSGNDVIYPLDDLLEPLRLTPQIVDNVIRDVPSQALDLRFTLMSRGQLENWPDYLENIRSQFKQELRPLHADIEPRTNPMRIACQRLAPADDGESPNLGVLYARDAREQGAVQAQFEALEKDRGVSKLPVLFVWDKGRADAEHSWLKSRRHALLQSPVRLPAMIQAINWLMA